MQTDPIDTEHRLTIVPDELQAEMLRSVLDQAGIRCVVRRAPMSQVQWGTIDVGMGGPREVVVNGEDIDAARAVLHGSGVPAGAADDDGVDTALTLRGRLLSASFGMMVLVLFGVPIALALVAVVLDALGVF